MANRIIIKSHFHYHGRVYHNWFSVGAGAAAAVCCPNSKTIIKSNKKNNLKEIKTKLNTKSLHKNLIPLTANNKKDKKNDEAGKWSMQNSINETGRAKEWKGKNVNYFVNGIELTQGQFLIA